MQETKEKVSVLYYIGILAVLLLIPVGYASAATVGSHSVGIVLSQTCITMNNAGINSTCPTYDDLIQLDNSDQDWSGYFIYDANGVLYRDNPPIQKSWRLYDHDDTWRVFVDPPRGMHERIKLITIHPNFDVYFDRADSQIDNYTRTVYHDRYVDNCWSATINADIWTILVADTIFYMQHGCLDSHTQFNHIEYIPIELVNHDISTSQKWKDEQRLKEIKQFCIFKYRSCTG